jgi:hypothetical protein
MKRKLAISYKTGKVDITLSYKTGKVDITLSYKTGKVDIPLTSLSTPQFTTPYEV